MRNVEIILPYNGCTKALPNVCTTKTIMDDENGWREYHHFVVGTDANYSVTVTTGEIPNGGGGVFVREYSTQQLTPQPRVAGAA
jgi:hypothetical protein